jgi:hypothetical protein
MGVQARQDNSRIPFIRSGTSLIRDAEVILQDAVRATPLLKYTVMAQIAATKKWVPLTAVAGVDGSAIAKGVYMGDDITAATLVAGDVVDVAILIGSDCTVDENQIVFDDGTLSKDSVVEAATVGVHRTEDDLNKVGIFLEATIDVERFEN